jgi:hypothetical protein
MALSLSWRLMKSKGQRPIANAVVKTSTQARSSVGAFGATTCIRNGTLRFKIGTSQAIVPKRHRN